MSNKITLNDPICKLLSAVPEKFVVDFANNITVAQDHERLQRPTKGFFARLYNGISGQEWQRQYEINSSLIKVAESQLTLLNELQGSVTFGLKAIEQVTSRLNQLTQNVKEITDFSVETRQMLQSLSCAVSERFQELEHRLAAIELETHSHSQLTQVFIKWQAGQFSNLPIGARAYAALEELNWGAYGDLIRTSDNRQVDKMLEHLSNLLVIQMRKDSDLDFETRVDYKFWLKPVTEKSEEFLLATEYLASDYKEQRAPFSCSVARHNSAMPIDVPRICSAERLSHALVAEVLGVRG